MENVAAFNKDVQENGGYRYTSNASFSSIVSNKRITDATLALIPESAATAIDIGCGDGTYTNDLKEALPHVFFAGLDLASQAIAAAKNRYPHVGFVVADLLDSGRLPRMKFDVAILRGVIHHLRDGARGIRNAGLLSDRLIIVEPNGNNPILKLIEKLSPYHIEHEEQSYTSAQLVQWCEESGNRVVNVDFIGFVPFFFPTALAKVIHFMQPLLEKVYLLKKYLSAQVVIACEKSKK